MNRIETVENYLKDKNLDAWILVDYENHNPAMVGFLGKKMLTRKIFLIVPKNEKPYVICHSIDAIFLKDNPDFELKVYKTWEEMLQIEKESFSNYEKVCMDMSENGLLPRVSLADYGSVDFVKKLGIEIVSSADILQKLTAVLDDEAKELQRIANKKVLSIKDEAFELIGKEIKKKGKANEYEIQQFICRRFKEEGMAWDDDPIVAIGPNASNPHYGPTKETNDDIHEDDLVLIDMWAKMDHPKGVYSDITWMGYVGKKVPDVYEKRFQILKKDIDLCVEFLRKNIGNRVVFGFEVDNVSRDYINEQGFGEYYTHRVGHSIAIDVSPHGCGVNMDDYETHDFREIIPNVCFSLEPGIYAPDFGIRSETNVLIDGNEVVVVAGRQDHIIPILK